MKNNFNEAEYKGKLKPDLIKYLTSINNQHMFIINGNSVKVFFSTEKNAQDIESILVKIASNREN